MMLKNLYLHNFRNYDRALFTFSPHLNVICGENAQGKTNLLEAIYLLSTGKSFKTLHLEELIKHEKDYFCLEAEIIKQGFPQTLKLFFSKKEKKLKIDETTHVSFSPLLGLLPSILFSHADMDLICGSPLLRRRFLNFHLAQQDPLYLHHLSRFWKALKQRNHLLKTKNEKTMEVWEETLHLSAIYLMEKRKLLIEELKKPLLHFSHILSPAKEHLDIHYLPSYEEKEPFLSFLQKNRSKEFFFGSTQKGPHKDDLTFWIDEKPAKTFASEGQKRTFLSSLKFAEWERFFQVSKEKALMQIDDLEVHLDQERKKLLQNLLLTLGQVFVTTPSSPHLWEGEKISIFPIEKGTLRSF